MKTGALNKEEKARIIDMLKNKKSVTEISQTLDRAEKGINKYIDEVKSIFFEQVEQIENVEEIIDEVKEAKEAEAKIAQPILDKAISQLIQYNLTRQSIKAKINRITKGMTPAQIKLLTADILISECIRQVNINDVMVNKTRGGNSGVSIMTEAGSERGDEAKKAMKPVLQPHMYKIF